MEYKLQLKIFSYKRSIDDIENIVKLKCDEKKIKGEPRAKKSVLVNEGNVWILNSNVDTSMPLDIHIRSVFNRINPNISNFKSLNGDFKVICQGIIEGDENPELHLPVDIIHMLSSINASFDVDMYIV